MRHLLLLLACLSSPAAIGQDFRQPVTAMLYWEKPIGGLEKNEAAGSFGFRLDRASATSSLVLRKPFVDVRFNDRGFYSLALRGYVLHQNQPASSGPVPEVNWWIIGGIIAGTAVLMRQDTKSNNNCRTVPGPSGQVAVCN
jgi:hypothetical protein